MSNISFVFWAMEFQTKLLLIFTDPKDTKRKFSTIFLFLPGFGGNLGAFERSSDLEELSSPPKGDSRFIKFRFSIDDFFLAALFSASWIKLEILLAGRGFFSTKK